MRNKIRAKFDYHRYPRDGEVGNFEFASKEEYERWLAKRNAQLALLNQPLNYNKNFERTSGQDGVFVHDGEWYPVKGTWDAYLVWSDWKVTKGFRDWLIERKITEDTWFELKDKYKKDLECTR